MPRKIKIILITLGILLQTIVVLLFGFTDIPVSSGIYLFVFLLCGGLIHHFLQSLEIYPKH